MLEFAGKPFSTVRVSLNSSAVSICDAMRQSGSPSDPLVAVLAELAKQYVCRISPLRLQPATSAEANMLVIETPTPEAFVEALAPMNLPLERRDPKPPQPLLKKPAKLQLV